MKVQDYTACLARVKGLQPLKYPTTNVFGLTAEWCYASNWVSSAFKLIKIWWDTLKVDAGGYGKQGIN